MSWTQEVQSFPPVPIDELYSNAKKWAEKGEWKKQKDLAIKKAVAIVTCMVGYSSQVTGETLKRLKEIFSRDESDCRVLPDRIFGLELGDAEYIRNAGGRVTDDIIRSLLIAQELLQTKEIVLMHHTDCGAQYATRKHDQFLETVQKKLGVDLSTYNALPIGTSIKDLENSVVEDVEKLEKSPLIAKDIPIYGVIYHTENGEVTEVIRKRSSQGKAQ